MIMGIMYRCSLGGGGETCEFIAPDYDANKTDYAADDVVLKDGKVMKYNGSEWEDFSLAECTTLNSNLGKVKYITSGVYYSTTYGTNIQSRTDFENLSAKTIIINKTTSSNDSGAITVQGSSTKDFSSDVVSIGEQNANGSTVTRDISGYKYIRLVVTIFNTANVRLPLVQFE